MAGRLDVDAVLASLSVEQLAEWQAYYLIEPFGGDWHRSAMLASVFAEANRDESQKKEPFSVEDFLPRTADLEDDADEDAEEAEIATPESTARNDMMDEDAPWRVWKLAMQAMAEAAPERKTE